MNAAKGGNCPVRSGLVWTLAVAVTVFVPSVARAQLNWMAQQRSTNSSTLSIPTAYGQSLGNTPFVSGTTNTAPDFGPWSNYIGGTVYGVSHDSSLSSGGAVASGEVYLPDWTAGLQYVNYRFGHSEFRGTFQLTAASDFTLSFSRTGIGAYGADPTCVLTPTVGSPIAFAPGVTTGTLDAGTWTLVARSAWTQQQAEQYGSSITGNSSFAMNFQVVPEPSAAALLSIAAGAATSRYPRRHRTTG